MRRILWQKLKESGELKEGLDYGEGFELNGKAESLGWVGAGLSKDFAKDHNCLSKTCPYRYSVIFPELRQSGKGQQLER
jgi:hypothetical protein